MNKILANPCPKEAYLLVSPALVPTVLLRPSLLVPCGPWSPSLTRPWPPSVLPEYPPIFDSQALALGVHWSFFWFMLPPLDLSSGDISSRRPPGSLLESQDLLSVLLGGPVTLRLIILCDRCLLTGPIFSLRPGAPAKLGLCLFITVPQVCKTWPLNKCMNKSKQDEVGKERLGRHTPTPPLSHPPAS